jgi:hypothetical protein
MAVESTHEELLRSGHPFCATDGISHRCGENVDTITRKMRKPIGWAVMESAEIIAGESSTYESPYL